MENERTVYAVSLLTAGAGMFLATLNTGIVNVALPALERVFQADVSAMGWSITMYLLALSGSIVLFGRLGDRYGRLKVYGIGLVLFACSSLLCGFSVSVRALIAFRTLQGIGAAMLQSIALAIVTTNVEPHRQGSALGTIGMIMGLGPVLGPSLGGLFLTIGDWRWIFWINVPVCLTGLWGCVFLARRTAESRRAVKLNLPGNAMLAAAMIGLLQALSRLSSGDASPADAAAGAAFLAFAALMLLLFFRWEKRAGEPIVPLSVLRSASYVVPLFGTVVFGAASAAAFMVAPYYSDRVLNLPSWQTGLVSLAAPLGIAVVSRQSGRRIASLGTGRLMTAGLLIMGVALASLSFVGEGWSVWWFMLLLFLYGIGGGVFNSPNVSAIMSGVEAGLQGTIGAVQRMLQNVGIALGTAVTVACIHAGSGGRAAWTLQDGLQWAWRFAFLWVAANLAGFLYLAASSRRKTIGTGLESESYRK